MDRVDSMEIAGGTGQAVPRSCPAFMSRVQNRAGGFCKCHDNPATLPNGIHLLLSLQHPGSFDPHVRRAVGEHET
jgi:hypothetical protein